MFETRIVCARRLMIDDRFKMGGNMYRIQGLFNDRYNGRTELVAVDIKNPLSVITASFNYNVRIKIYNLPAPVMK